jgi:effector-binding domain-containing protein
MEDKMSEYDVVIKTVPAMLLASQKMTVHSNEQVPDYFEKAHQALWAFIKEHNLKVLSPHMTIWHQEPEVMKNEVVEVTFEIDAAIPGNEEILVYTLPETRVVSFVHQGNFEDFQIGHKVLLKWIEENGYRATGGYCEIYIKHDPSDLSDSVTEIQFPVERISTNDLEKA